jgi:hypothetical protein
MAINRVSGFAVLGNMPASPDYDLTSSDPIITLFYALPNPILEHQQVGFYWTAPNVAKVRITGGFSSGILDNSLGYGLYTHVPGFTKTTDVTVSALDDLDQPIIVDSVPLTATITIMMQFDNGEAPVAQSFAGTIVTKTDDYTASVSDYTILVDATAKAITIYLMGSPAIGQIIHIKKIDTTNHKVTIHGNGRNIDGAASVALSSPMQGRCCQFDGTNWFII